MRILLTNYNLQGRTGTEVYIFELCLALIERGHLPVVYSPRLGPMAEALRSKTVPVIDDLRTLSEPPDIIHAHHSPVAVEALLRFPKVPAVFVCHDRLAWHDDPPRFERFVRSVAVDHNCRERLVTEAGIDPSKVRVLYNAVDLQKFVPRNEALPDKPRRALVFSNQEGQFEAVRKACEAAGIQAERMDQHQQRGSAPEKILPQFDLVFAKARCALEAMAVGCGVVVCDEAGLGGLVTEENYDRMRSLNFGRRLLQKPVDPAIVATEIARYSASDATLVSQRVRAEASLDGLVDQWLSLYEEVLEEFDPAAHSTEQELAEAADYLKSLNPWLAHLSLVEVGKRVRALLPWWLRSKLRKLKG